ncbi:glycerate kinase [Isoptericola sp. b490]|uniref:glycerate kinase n=1 Tax=Actinotalea lenta TaxID=3064654 RepID=UPI002713F39C|nr:glycerate kinase [Isoptericola sp. b490]MDO8120183.1 glycerate kinase [Isoptericola sp. b490]
MKIVLAPDSFKESMSAREAVRAMATGVRRAAPDAHVTLVPMADGGEGTARTVSDALGGVLREVETVDALGRARRGRIGWVARERLAVVEVAQAVGLDLIAPTERDALAASSTGVADLLRGAWEAGAQRVLVGLGGSATTDGGLGMLLGLGARALPVRPVRCDWADLAGLDLTGLDPRLGRVEVAVDVDNPLTGPRGAAAVFAPQKGADPAAVAVLIRRLEHLARALRAGGRDVAGLPGAGAAGGLGAAFLAAGARLAPGATLVAEAVGLAEAVHGADLVLTGEGRVDGQTPSGKVPAGVAAVARAAGVPVVVLAGSLGPGWQEARDALGPVVVIGPAERPLAEALAHGPADLADATERVVADRIAGARR